MHRLNILLAAVASVLLAGCSAGAPLQGQGSVLLPDPALASHSTPPDAWRPKTFLPPQPMTIEEAGQMREQTLASHARNMGLTDPKTPPLVRWVTNDEGLQIQGRCLEERGFTLQWRADGLGYSVKNVAAQDGSFALADYQCLAQYTPDPRQSLFNEAQKGIVWEYTRDHVIPCLRKHGFPVLADLPSREVFVASSGSWEGYPIDNKAAISACRPSPPSQALLGGSY